MPAIVPGIAAAAMALAGHPLRAVILATVAVLAAAAIALGVPVARGIERGAEATASAVVAVVLGAGFLFVAVPGWLWRRVRPAGDERGPRWRSPTSTAREQTTSMGSGGAPIRLRTQALALFGAAVALLIVDFSIGSAWDAALPTDPPPGVAAETYQNPATAGIRDPRIDAPAMAGAAWAPSYFAALNRQSTNYWPFTAYRPDDIASRYLNVTDWVRRSWEPGTAEGDLPTVWAFGGSAMFGEGQRDAHTIPSEIARLADRDGLPVKVVNYGQRAWVSMQEMHLYEQELALQRDPDFAVFYDGPNDLQAAALFDDPIATDLNADAYAQLIRGRHLTTLTVAGEREDSLSQQLLAAYAKHSAARKVVRWLFGDEPAGAQATTPTTTPAQGGSDGHTDAEFDQNGNVVWGTVGDGEQGLEIYGRSKDLIGFLSREHHVTTTWFWQPVATHQDAVTYARSHLPKGVVDLSEVFGDDGQDVYIDTTHTNEHGARTVAEAMWEQLRPKVEAWYRRHR